MNFWLREAARKNSEKEAVIYKNQTLTYKELLRDVFILARKLPKINRVGVFLDNSLESVVLIHSLIERGIQIVIINTRLSEKEIKKQLEDVSVDTLITTIETDFFDDSKVKVIKYKDILSRVEKEYELADYPSVNNTILSIMFTSGTTGRAKAVAQSFRNHYASHINATNGLQYDSYSKWLMINPIFHISGFSIVMRAVISQCTLIIHNKFREVDVLQDIEKYQVTHTSFVPLMLSRLMQHPLLKKTDTSSLKAVLMGGANTTPKLLEDALRVKLPVFNSFGMTETCSQIVMIPYTDPMILSSAVGRIHRGIKVTESGELLVRGDNVASNYLNAEMEKVGDYFNTGDIAKVEAGYLYILDRRQDLIISGGENIYPKEIEEAISKFIGHRECVVVKRKDREWGEVPVLLIEGTVDATILDSIKLNLNSVLAKYKHPKAILFVEKILHTDSGKVSRRLNQEAYIKEKN